MGVHINETCYKTGRVSTRDFTVDYLKKFNVEFIRNVFLLSGLIDWFKNIIASPFYFRRFKTIYQEFIKAVFFKNISKTVWICIFSYHLVSCNLEKVSDFLFSKKKPSWPLWVATEPNLNQVFEELWRLSALDTPLISTKITLI